MHARFVWVGIQVPQRMLRVMNSARSSDLERRRAQEPFFLGGFCETVEIRRCKHFLCRNVKWREKNIYMYNIAFEAKALMNPSQHFVEKIEAMPMNAPP